MRPHTLLRHLLLVATLALPAGAQVVRTDFREFTSTFTTEYDAAIGAPLTSGGLDFYSAGEFSASSTNALATFGTDDEGAVNRPSNLMGANTLFIPGLGGRLDIVLAGTRFGFGPGGSFGLQSIDFAHLFEDSFLPAPAVNTAITLQIFGFNSRNESFFQNFIIPVAPIENGRRTPRLITARLDSRFSDVNNVRYFQGTGSGRAFQFTNVIPTPEPASFILLGTGLLGVFGITARSRRNRSTPIA
ncbi:MAG: PEP-CTERM sorting domain-containing protein [Gemmatimonadaceae bacterium]